MLPSGPSPLAHQLPDGWSVPESVFDSISIGGVELFRAGWASKGPGGLEVTGSAAGPRPDSTERAGFELLERVATVEAIGDARDEVVLWSEDERPVGACPRSTAFPESPEPGRWRFARSNGVALQRGWRSACMSARSELAERDRVLRSWFGELTPIAVEPPAKLVTITSHEWRAALLPATEGSWSADVRVVFVVGLPRRSDLPLALGYGAAPNIGRALEKAELEALQSLAFLWGEPIPTEAPMAAPSALGHLDWWLYPGHHAELRRWLDGEHAHHRRHGAERSEDDVVSYVDLTPGWSPDGLRVVKAVCRAAMPLAFGDAPFPEDAPPSIRIHPIV